MSEILKALRIEIARCRKLCGDSQLTDAVNLVVLGWTKQVMVESADHMEAIEAALRANTKWLNTLGPDLSDPDYARITHELIAANEAVLRGAK